MSNNNPFKQVFIVLLFLFTPPVFALTEMSLDEVSRGSLLTKTDSEGVYRSIPLQKTDVKMNITGPIARTVLTQTFSNPGDEWLEAIYAFPLPENAAVDHLDMVVGDRIIQGQIKEKQQAKTIYETAKREGKRTALVQQHRPNLFTTSVANIPPKGEIQIKLQFQQMLSWKDQQFSIRFPMAITPRYKPASEMPATERVEIEHVVASGWSILPGEIPNAIPINPVEIAEQAAQPGNTSISIELDAGFPLAKIRSRYHAINQQQQDDRVSVSLKEGKIKADRDFVLEWQPQQEFRPTAAFFTQTVEQDNYGLLMVMPPTAGSEQPLPAREMIFVIDTSGSMGGESIRQARSALAEGINKLGPRDNFNIIEFNSSPRRLFNTSIAATQGNKNIAINEISKLDAGGGTEMLSALKQALLLQNRSANRLRQVVFITDGAVGNEKQLLAFIENNLGASRLFTVGIGSAPNSYFMIESAHFGRGTYTYISRPDEVQEKMKALFHRIEQPVLTNLKLKLDQQAELLPHKLPDLYAGEPMIVALKTGASIKQATLTGRRGSTEWRQKLTLTSGSPQTGLDVNWGREKIHHWMRSGIKGVPHEKVREEIIKLGLKHHLVSQYTSLVAVDVTPVRPVDQELNKHALKGQMPAGLKVNRQTVSLAQGATDSKALILLGLLMLVTAWLLSGHRFNLRSKT